MAGDYLNPKKPPKGSRPAPTPPPPPPARNVGLNLPGAPAITYPNTPPPPRYVPPPQQWAPAPVQQNWAPAPAQQNWSAPAQMQAFSAPAPPPPPPPPDTRRRINQKSINNQEIGELDSTFLDQDAALDSALKKFIADQQEEEGRQTRDTDTAITGVNRNKTVGLTGLSEDFAARGLMNSGLFAKANADAGTEYEKQKQGLSQMLADNKSKLKSQRGKFESETNATRQSARNEALARLARRADLVVEG